MIFWQPNSDKGKDVMLSNSALDLPSISKRWTTVPGLSWDYWEWKCLVEARVTNRGCWKRQRQSEGGTSWFYCLHSPQILQYSFLLAELTWKPAGKEAGETEFPVTLTTSEQKKGSRRIMMSTMIPIKKIGEVTQRIKNKCAPLDLTLTLTP